MPPAAVVPATDLAAKQSAPVCVNVSLPAGLQKGRFFLGPSESASPPPCHAGGREVEGWDFEK